MIEPAHGQISLRRQCALLGLSRASLYYEPRPESEQALRLMRLLDEQHTHARALPWHSPHDRLAARARS